LWRGANVEPRALPVYRPDLEEPAYYEFKVAVEGKDAGYVLASTGDHDAPIASFRTAGATLTEDYGSGSEAPDAIARFHRLDLFTLLAEDAAGELLEHEPGSFRVPFDRAGWQATKRDFKRQERERLLAQRDKVAPLWRLEATKRGRRAPVKLAPGGGIDVGLCPVEGCGGDVPPGTRIPIQANCSYAWARGDNPSDVNPPTPRWNQWVGNFDDGQRYSGCSPTAMAIFLGWVSRQRVQTLSPIGEWGRPGMENAFANYVQTPIWVPQQTIGGSGACSRVDDCQAGEVVPAHWITVTQRKPAIAPYDFEAADYTGTTSIDAMVTEIGRTLGTHAGDGNPPEGSTSSDQFWRFRDQLAAYGLPIDMWIHDADPNDKIAGIQDGLFNHHAPVVINFQLPAGGHTAVIDAEQVCASDMGSITYLRINKGWGGSGDEWVPWLGAFHDEDLHQVYRFTAQACAGGPCPQAATMRRGVRGDMNGDGRADLVLAGGDGWGSMPIAFSNGDGTYRGTNFGEPAGLSGFAALARQTGAKLVSGDFNGDGYTDLALIGGTGWSSIPIAFSTGYGRYRFTNAGMSSGDLNLPAYATQFGARPVVGDFNHDGRDDIALVGGLGWGTIPIAFSNGDGTWSGTNGGITWGDGLFPWYATLAGAKPVAGDFNGDGYGDIALVGGLGWGTMPVAFSNGNGTFGATNRGATSGDTNFAYYATLSGATPLAGDFDHDGDDDLVLVGGAGWGTMPIAFSNRDGSFRGANGGETSGDTGFAWYAQLSGARPVVGDFNGDGYADLALAGGVGWGSMPIAFSNGDGTYRGTNGGETSGDTGFASYATQNGAVLVRPERQ
jgi:hypothetical protein